jgi:hypothetical protein
MKMKKLTARQQAALKRHGVHHTAKHMTDGTAQKIVWAKADKSETICNGQGGSKT